MKNLSLPVFSKLVFTIFITLLICNFIGAFTENPIINKFTFLLLIPLFSITFLWRFQKLNVAVLAFLSFSLLGNLSTIFLKDTFTGLLSDGFHLLSFISLILLTLPSLKLKRIDMVVGGYLILVLSINLYLLYSLYKFLIDIMLNDLAVKIFAVKSLALIILASVAFGAYLSYQTKKAILFLIATACFGFATILEFLNSYYSSALSFLMVDRILYIVGVYFMFRYAIAEAIVDIKKDIMKNKMKPYFNKGVLN